MEAQITSKQITYGNQQYKVDSKGNWQVQTFGFHITSPNATAPSYGWYPIPENRVPQEVKDKQ